MSYAHDIMKIIMQTSRNSNGNRKNKMKKLTETQKSIIKWTFVLVLLGLIVYVFRDMAGPIAKQLVKTSPWIIVLILVATLLYGVFESTGLSE